MRPKCKEEGCEKFAVRTGGVGRCREHTHKWLDQFGKGPFRESE